MLKNFKQKYQKPQNWFCRLLPPGTCKMMAPIVDQVSEEMKGKAKVYKIDVDQARDLAAKYRIMSVLTFIFFKNGEVVEKIPNASAKKL